MFHETCHFQVVGWLDRVGGTGIGRLEVPGFGPLICNWSCSRGGVENEEFRGCGQVVWYPHFPP